MDLFEHPDRLPKEVREVIEKYVENWDETWEQCSNMRDELEVLGYTFEYYLTAVPYALRKIGDPIPEEYL